MAWTLEIHHLDVQSTGDATLIVARDEQQQQDGTTRKTVKTVLIDGGETKGGPIIEEYLKDKNIDKIDVVAVTHYDKDHYYGIISLFETTSYCDGAIVYDIGKLVCPRDEVTEVEKVRQREEAEDTNTRTPGKSAAGAGQVGTRKKARTETDSPEKRKYYKYVYLVRKKMTRATDKVNGFDIVLYDRNNAATIPRGRVDDCLEPSWLVGKEIMWGNGLDGQDGRGPFASAPPPGAPTITCIAANKYVRQPDDSVRFVSARNIYDGPKKKYFGPGSDNDPMQNNDHSLGLVIQFNNFRYYVAGDIESVQEDGCNNPHNDIFQPGIGNLLNPNNPNDTMAGRVLAMKASHHGSAKSSSRAFITRLRPSAVFISTGQGNKHDHPAQSVINVLDGYAAAPPNGDQADGGRHPAAPPSAPLPPVKYYLTGYQTQAEGGEWLSYVEDSGETAGNPYLDNIPGHLCLTVTEEQSRKSVEGQWYRGIRAAARETALAVGRAEFTDAQARTIADEGATYGAAAAVACVIGAPRSAATKALEATAWVGNFRKDEGIIATAVAMGEARQSPDDIARAITQVTAEYKIEKKKQGVETVHVQPYLQLPTGTATAIGWAVQWQSVEKLRAAAISVGASPDEAEAAARAVEQIVKSPNLGSPLNAPPYRDNMGFAAAAALSAVAGGANAQQASIIAATIVADLQASGARTTGHEITRIASVILGDHQLAAIAGAVAGATLHRGDPEKVQIATTAALTVINLDANTAQAVGEQAKSKVTLNPDNTLFSVKYQYTKAEDKDHATLDATDLHTY